MFERFTESARRAVVAAQEETRRLGHTSIGDEHLLLGVLDGTDTPAARVLAEIGLDAATLRERLTGGDAEALSAIGISLDEVRGAVEASFGSGALDRSGPSQKHIPFTPKAKEALENSLREALEAGSKEITPGHLVLGLLRTGGRAVDLIESTGTTADAVRRLVVDAPGPQS